MFFGRHGFGAYFDDAAGWGKHLSAPSTRLASKREVVHR